MLCLIKGEGLLYLFLLILQKVNREILKKNLFSFCILLKVLIQN